MKLSCASFIVLGVSALKQCERHVELMILQDASTSYFEMSHTMAKNMGLLIEQIKKKIGSVVASVSLFSDKPTPFRGNGKGRGHPGVLDVCYYNGATYPLGSDADKLQEGYNAIADQKCEGGDYPENPFEAMIYAAQDPKVNWSSAGRNYTEDNRRIVKVIVTVTDDHPHYAGDARAGVVAWNPLTKGSRNDGYPRFYDKNFSQLNAIYNDDEGRNLSKYARLVELHGKKNLNSTDEQEMQDLLSLLGPATFEQPIEHPGTFVLYKDCEKYEYPKLELVGKILNRENVLPIILLSKQSFNFNGEKLCRMRGYSAIKDENDWLECLIEIYRSDLAQAGVNAFMVEPYGDQVEELIKQIVELVDKLSYDITCPDDSIVPVVPPHITPSGGGSSSTSKIAGATGAAIAGVGAIGGLLYKTFGGSLLGSSSPPDLTAVEQVDTPVSPIEREAFEEVTMDMFQ